MRSILCCSFFCILIFNACSPPQIAPSLKGNWIQAGQFILTDQDTVWQRQAFIWELNADSSGQIYQFQLQQELTANAQEIQWQLENGKLKLETAAATEYWSIISHTADSLILQAPQNPKLPQKIYWLFRRMQLPAQAQDNQAMAKLLQNELQEVSITSYNNQSPLQWEAIGHHFIHPNIPQSWYLPLRWGVIDFKGQTLIALQAILSGQVNQWELMEVDQFAPPLITGRYFKKGKAEQLKFKSVTASISLQADQLLGSWQGTASIQNLEFTEDSQYQMQSSDGNTEGSYWVSKTVPLVYLQTGYRFQYLKIDSITVSSIEAELYSPQIKGEKIQLKKNQKVQ